MASAALAASLAATPGVVVAQMGETLDALLWRTFARGPGMVEAVFAANPDLATAGPVLAEGTRVVIPAAAVALPQTGEVKLWD